MTLKQEPISLAAAQPLARVKDLVITESGSDLLIYDLDHHHIHHLNPITAAVWRAIDGQRTIDEVAQSVSSVLGTPVGAYVVEDALARLDKAHLLATPLTTVVRGTPRSRRAFMRNAAVAGAVAAPLVVSISAPRAAAAQSGVCEGTLPPVLEDQCKNARPGQCCCDAPGEPDEDCGHCGLAPGDDEDDDMKCLHNEN